MATTQNGGLYLTPNGRTVDANGKPARRSSADDTGSDNTSGDDSEDFDPTGEPSLSGLTTAQLKAVAEHEEVSLDGAKNNGERGARIETARLVRTVMTDREGLASRSADDLAAVASALDIEGRSDMNKDALVEALAAEIDASE